MKKIFVLFILIGMLSGIGWYVAKNMTQNSNTISGNIDLNGIVPSDSSLILYQRRANSQDQFAAFAQEVAAQDGIQWKFSNPEKGRSYEIQAALVVNNTIVTKSSPIFVTAPALHEQLVLNVASENLVAAAIATPTPAQAIISGTVGVNGYIPPGATITVEGRSLGKTTYTVVASNLPAVDNQVMTYTTAVAGRTYEVRGSLYDNTGNQIGQSNIITITAPAKNEILNINSTAQAPITPTPTPQATIPTTAPASSVISGTINFNGQAPTNSRIVVFQRVSGTNQYQVASNNVQPIDGTIWGWSNGTAGTSYDLLAVLKQKQDDGTDKDISNSNVITVSAPAANETFTLNSGFSLPAPSGSINVSCNNYDSGSKKWQVFVSFPSMSGAQTYWVEIGTTNGGVELSNDTPVATNNPTQSNPYTFNNNVTYYARYAYATVPNIHADSPQFSPFSNTQELRCSQ